MGEPRAAQVLAVVWVTDGSPLICTRHTTSQCRTQKCRGYLLVPVPRGCLDFAFTNCALLFCTARYRRQQCGTVPELQTHCLRLPSAFWHGSETFLWSMAGLSRLGSVPKPAQCVCAMQKFLQSLRRWHHGPCVVFLAGGLTPPLLHIRLFGQPPPPEVKNCASPRQAKLVHCLRTACALRARTACALRAMPTQ